MSRLLIKKDVYYFQGYSLRNEKNTRKCFFTCSSQLISLTMQTTSGLDWSSFRLALLALSARSDKIYEHIWNISSHLTDEFATDNIFEEVVSSCVYFDKLRRNQMSIYFISANKCNIVISARKCDIVISACKFDIVSFENAGASKFTCCCRNLTVDLALSIFCLAFSYIT